MIFQPLDISDAFAERHKGKTAISSRSGELLGYGKDAIEAIKMAKKKKPNLHPDEYTISRIHGKILIA